MEAPAVLGLLVGCALGCTGTISGADADGAGAASTVLARDAGAAAVATPAPSLAPDPGDPEATRAWLRAFGYRGWTPMTGLRTVGAHGGERLYFNAALAASWRAGADEHPVGGAAVRELWSADLTTLTGHAYMQKTGPAGPAGEGWYWFEALEGFEASAAAPTVAEHGARACVGCHAHAVDFVHDPAVPREDPPG